MPQRPSLRPALVDGIAGTAVLRLSAYVYNTADDIRLAFDALDELHPYLAGS